MNPESVVAALEAWDAAAVLGSRRQAGQTSIEIAAQKIVAVCRCLKQEQQFGRLSGVTAVDWHPSEPRFEIVYLLHSLARNERVRLRCRIPGEPAEIDSVTGVWANANWYEREVFDLFGVRFRNHPDLRRIMLPEDWEGHPLRKDYPVAGYRYGYQEEK
jgi:NADH-quinone oxidoreductase subunit C